MRFFQAGAERETIFRDHNVLEFDFQPKMVRFRENHQFCIADAIKPLLNDRRGSNVLVFGSSGVGKTLACKHVLRELAETTDSIMPLFVNCWEHNTSYKIGLELCNQLKYPFTQNRKTPALFALITEKLNAKPSVVVFDEFDKVSDMDFLYFLSEKVLKQSMILISNARNGVMSLDRRIRSRLFLESLAFEPYSYEETLAILKERIEYAFMPDTWPTEAVKLAADKTFELRDIRSGLLILKRAGKIADDSGSISIMVDYVNQVLEKAATYTLRGSSYLDGETRSILQLARANRGSNVAEIFKTYEKNGGGMGYRNFYRKIRALELNKYITLAKVYGGRQGNYSKIFSTKS